MVYQFYKFIPKNIACSYHISSILPYIIIGILVSVAARTILMNGTAICLFDLFPPTPKFLLK